jgi:hypothetical protein
MKKLWEMSNEERNELVNEVVKTAFYRYAEEMGGMNGLGIFVLIMQNNTEDNTHTSVYTSNLGYKNVLDLIRECEPRLVELANNTTNDTMRN